MIPIWQNNVRVLYLVFALRADDSLKSMLSFENCLLIEVYFLVLGILPPGKFPPERSATVYSPKECSFPMLFRFVARFARVMNEDSSRKSFASTAYFAQSQTTLFPWIIFLGGMFRGGNNRGGTFRGEYSGHLFFSIQYDKLRS